MEDNGTNPRVLSKAFDLSCVYSLCFVGVIYETKRGWGAWAVNVTLLLLLGEGFEAKSDRKRRLDTILQNLAER